MGKKSGSGSGIRDEQPGSYSYFWVKILKFFYAYLGSGMEKIRDGKKSDPGSGINIPDPQHCLKPHFKS
jgi:hypothetical protein